MGLGVGRSIDRRRAYCEITGLKYFNQLESVQLWIHYIRTPVVAKNVAAMLIIFPWHVSCVGVITTRFNQKTM